MKPVSEPQRPTYEPEIQIRGYWKKSWWSLEFCYFDKWPTLDQIDQVKDCYSWDKEADK